MRRSLIDESRCVVRKGGGGLSSLTVRSDAARGWWCKFLEGAMVSYVLLLWFSNAVFEDRGMLRYVGGGDGNVGW